LTNTIEDILKSEKSGNCSNIKISPSSRPQLLRAIKDEKQPYQKQTTQKLEETVHNARHKSFVKCVEWTRTCDMEELSNTGVM
jgi:tRNA G18 (ribose-2'-O)-methylase SpoU